MANKDYQYYNLFLDSFLDFLHSKHISVPKYILNIKYPNTKTTKEIFKKLQESGLNNYFAARILERTAPALRKSIEEITGEEFEGTNARQAGLILSLYRRQIHKRIISLLRKDDLRYINTLCEEAYSKQS